MNLLLDVGAETGLDLHDCAVVETNLPDGEVFDSVGLVVPVRPGADDLRGLVAHVGPGHSAGCDGVGFSHCIVGGLDHVHADVNHRSAALEFLLAEDAPVRNATPTQRMDFDEHDVANHPRVAGTDKHFGVGVVALLETADQEFLGFLRRIAHLGAFGGIHGHRLFDDHMTAGLQCGDGGGAVHAVGGANVHDVNLLLLEHLIVVGVGRGVLAARLLLKPHLALGLDVASGHDFDFGNLADGVDVGAGDAAGADECPAQALGDFLDGGGGEGLSADGLVSHDELSLKTG